MRLIVVLIFALSASSLLADDQLDAITTTDGKTYSNVIVKRSDPSGLDIVFDAGAAHLRFDKLPKDIQSRYGYDPVKAAAFAQQQAKERAEAMQELQNELQKDLPVSPSDKQSTSYLADRAKKIDDSIKILQKERDTISWQIDQIEKKREEWMAHHPPVRTNYHRSHLPTVKDVPDDISVECEQELQGRLDDLNGQIAFLASRK